MIYGDASAVGTVTGWEDYVIGETEEYSDNLTFPNTNAELYKTIAQEGDTVGDLIYNDGSMHYIGPLYITGNMQIDAWTAVTLEGPLYIEGNLTINNGFIFGNEHILCKGDVTINGGVYVGSEFVPVITSVDGSITAGGGGIIEAVLYAPNGNLVLSQTTLYGAAGGLQVTVDNAWIWYSEKLHGRADLPGSELYPLTYSYD
jgi:hypothetical protein